MRFVYASFKGFTEHWKFNCYICLHNKMCSAIKLRGTETKEKREQENGSRLHSLADPITAYHGRSIQVTKLFSWQDQNSAYQCSPSSRTMPTLRESNAWVLTKSGIEMSKEKPCSFMLDCLTSLEQERWINFSLPLSSVSLEVFQLFSTISSCVTLTLATTSYKCIHILSRYSFPCTPLVVSPSQMYLLLH